MGQSAGRLPRKMHAGSMPSVNGVSICFSASSGITSSPTMKFDADQPTSLLTEIRAYRLNGRQCRCKADLDFLTFCVLEEATRTTADDLDEDGAEQPRLPRAVMDRRCQPGPEPTTLEAVVNQWHYALVVQAGEEEEDLMHTVLFSFFRVVEMYFHMSLLCLETCHSIKKTIF